ncbi:MAG: hypothetical protein ACRYF3_15935 [Janthinobacterium lividum]
MPCHDDGVQRPGRVLGRRALLGFGCGATLAGCASHRPAPDDSRRPAPDDTSATSVLAPTAASTDGVEGTVADVSALLAARGRALLARDLDAAGAVFVTTAVHREAIRRSDSRALASGLVQWAGDVTTVQDRVAQVGLRVRVLGEGREVRTSGQVGIVRANGRWALSPSEDPGPPMPWDLGDVQAHQVDGGVVLVVHPDGAGEPDALGVVAAGARADLPVASARVDELWGADWPRGAAVVVVPTSELAARLAALDPARVAVLDALAVGEDARLPDGKPAGVRVVLAADRFSRLSRLGRTITLTHELVHVATRASTSVQPFAVGDNPLPRWLVEGYADHVARVGRDVSARKLATPLLDAIAGGAVPVVPTDADFSTTDAEALQVTYASAWTLVTSAARRAGTPSVSACYRALASAPEAGGVAAGPVAARLDAACRATLGRGWAQVQQDWLADVAGGLTGWTP